jgi:mannose-6-phosphate isomerase-like protein (cupin superfamily)
LNYWRKAEILETTADGHYRRMVVQSERIRSGTLSFAPNDRVQEHAHQNSDEVFYIISGTGRIVVEGDVVEVSSGDLIFIPSGDRHAILVDDAAHEPLVMFAAHTPNLADDAVFSSEPFPLTSPS